MLNVKALRDHFASNNTTLDVVIEEEGLHQAILTACYNEWQPQADWCYSDMVDHAETKFGEIAKFAVLTGKFNQQVTNGGIDQYWDNGYASRDSEGCFSKHDNCELHNELIQLMIKYQDQLESSDYRIVLGIMQECDFEVDDLEFFDEYGWDDEEDEGDMYNDNYGCLLKDHSELNSMYYQVDEAWINQLEDFFLLYTK